MYMALTGVLGIGERGGGDGGFMWSGVWGEGLGGTGMDNRKGMGGWCWGLMVG